MNALDVDAMEYERSVLKLRFLGPELEFRSIPIYELGNALIPLQKIVNKTYLFQRNRLDRHARLTAVERDLLSLQIASRKKESDGYGLMPILTDPAIGPIVQGCVSAALIAVAAYAWEKISSKRTTAAEHNLQPLVASLYDEVRQLTERIGAQGKVSSIELLPNLEERTPPVILTSETKQYVKRIADEEILGPRTTIRGLVVSLRPQHFTVDISMSERRVSVKMQESDFQNIRYRAKSNTVVSFTGHPLYFLRESSGVYTHFKADRASITRLKSAE